MKKGRHLIILILLMIIGFASVTTTLIINGNIEIGTNKKDFDVYFSNSIVNDVEAKKLIKDDTHISFSQDMSIVGEKYKLEYDVTNGSINYDASVIINCTEANEYLTVENEFDTEHELLSKETRRGLLTLEVIKPYIGTDKEPTNDIEITCEIVASPIERDSIADGTPANKVKYNPWELTEDNDGNKKVSKGDLITLGTENFYVYDIVGDTVKAIAQYNLEVGNSSNSYYPADKETNIQSSKAMGLKSGMDIYATVVFSNEEKHGEYPNSYRGSIVEEYVNNYINILKDKYNVDITGRLITIEELEKLGCEDYSCPLAPEYVYSTSYWFKTPTNEDGDYAWGIDSNGDYGDGDIDDYVCGVRPVIEIAKSALEQN